MAAGYGTSNFELCLRKAASGRIRVYDEPVDEVDKSGAQRKAFPHLT